MAAVLRVKRRRDAEPAGILVLSAGGTVASSLSSTPLADKTDVDAGSSSLRFKRLCSISTLDDGAELLPQHVSGAIKAATEVRHVRKRIREEALAARATKVGPISGGTSDLAAALNSIDDDTDNADDEPVYHARKRRMPVPVRIFDIDAGMRTSASAGVVLPGASQQRDAATRADIVAGTIGDENATALPQAAHVTASLVRRWDARLLAAPRAAALSSVASTAAASPGKAPAFRVLTPFQRQMDEAIWQTFRSGALARIFEALSSGCEINYRRLQSDQTTALMAAAFMGDERACASLAKRGALAHLRDKEGRAAHDYAALHGHHVLAATLRDLARSEGAALGIDVGLPSATAGANEGAPAVTAGSTDGGGGDLTHTYDIYVMEDTGDEQQDGGTGGSAGSNASNAAASSSTSAESVLLLDPVSLAIARNAANDMECDDWDLLEVDVPGQTDDDGYDSEDSNAEDAPGNEYPDEDEAGRYGDDDSRDSEDDEQYAHGLGLDAGGNTRGRQRRGGGGREHEQYLPADDEDED